MLRKRIIFTLIYADGFFTQSRNFRLQKVGNLNWLERNYKFHKTAFALDELIILNGSKENKDITEFNILLDKLTTNIFIPVCVGGGIRDIQDAKMLFSAGADKIIINTILFTNTTLVEQLVTKYGSQSIIASIDYKKIQGKNRVFIENGTQELDVDLEQYIIDIQELNIGEIYLNSIDQDGTGFGYDLETIENLSSNLYVPIIIAGGAGNETHLINGLKNKHISAVATANLFNFIGDGLANMRRNIIEKKFNIAKWR